MQKAQESCSNCNDGSADTTQSYVRYDFRDERGKGSTITPTSKEDLRGNFTKGLLRSTAPHQGAQPTQGFGNRRQLDSSCEEDSFPHLHDTWSRVSCQGTQSLQHMAVQTATNPCSICRGIVALRAARAACMQRLRLQVCSRRL